MDACWHETQACMRHSVGEKHSIDTQRKRKMHASGRSAHAHLCIPSAATMLRPWRRLAIGMQRLDFNRGARGAPCAWRMPRLFMDTAMGPFARDIAG